MSDEDHAAVLKTIDACRVAALANHPDLKPMFVTASKRFNAAYKTALV